MMYYKKLDFKCPPQDLLDQCIQQVERNIGRIGYVHNDESCTDFSTRLNSPWQEANKSVNYKNTTYVTWEIPNEVVSWCKDNLPIEKADKIILQSFENGELVIPHVDFKCVTSINLLLTNNELAVTNWFEPKDEYKNLEFPLINEAGQFLYDRLNKVEEVVLERNVWYLLKTRKIHNVENLNNKRRLSIRIIFYSDQFQNF